MKTLKAGQQWKTIGGKLEITKVGKTLIQFRIFKADYKRSTAIGLLNFNAFQAYLKRNKGILLPKG